QAEDGIRDPLVTGVQTCALPISREVRSPQGRYHVRTEGCQEARGRGVLHDRRSAPARHRLDLGRGGHLYPIGPPLRSAAHGTVRPPTDGAGVVLHLQRRGRCRRADRRHQASPGGLCLMAVSYEMYQEQILDHYKHPRNKGSLPSATKNARDTNPLCGDEVVLHLKIDGSDRIADVRFEGQGCAISQASASMLTTIVKGMSLGDATALDRDAILKKLGIPLSAVR